MEFNAIVNRFLHKDAESRRRQLHLRIYVSLLYWAFQTVACRMLMKHLPGDSAPSNATLGLFDSCHALL